VTFPVSTPEITRNGKTIKLAGTASDSSGLDKIACGTAAGLTDCTGTATWTSSVVAIGDGTTNVSVKATDQLGNMSTKNIPVTYIESSPDEGWNGLSMVSLPVIPDYTDPKLTVAFSNNYWLAYLPSSNSYIKYGSSGLNSKLCWFEPRDSAIGKGYWALFTGTVPVPTGTVPKQTSAVKIHLYPGWNLIGLPFISEVKWDLSALQVESGSIIKSLADSANIVLNHGWGWDTVKKEYYLVYDNSILSTVAGYLKPWQGYWVKAFAECNLVITPQAVQQ
jgi:hypothetical protein